MHDLLSLLTQEMSICTAAWLSSLWKELGMGVSREEVKKGSRSHYMWAFMLSASGCGLGHLVSVSCSQSARKKSAVLATSSFALMHWEYTESRVYESWFCSCSDIAVLKPQYQLNINQPLDAEFIGPVK